MSLPGAATITEVCSSGNDQYSLVQAETVNSGIVDIAGMGK
jgi:hypothetical protein